VLELLASERAGHVLQSRVWHCAGSPSLEMGSPEKITIP